MSSRENSTVKADFGQSKFGQSKFGQPILANPFLANLLCCVLFVCCLFVLFVCVVCVVLCCVVLFVLWCVSVGCGVVLWFGLSESPKRALFRALLSKTPKARNFGPPTLQGPFFAGFLCRSRNGQNRLGQSRSKLFGQSRLGPKLVKSGWPKRDWPKSVSSEFHHPLHPQILRRSWQNCVFAWQSCSERGTSCVRISIHGLGEARRSVKLFSLETAIASACLCPR